MVNRSATEKFITDAVLKHGDRYDYSRSTYTTSQSKIVISCPYHGPFIQSAASHLRGAGCKQCYLDRKKSQVTTNDFVRRSMEVHGVKYDYSKSIYNGALAKLEIICPIHGSFWQRAGQHMLGQKCAKCYHDGMRKPEEQFINEAALVHGNTYDYSNTQYTGYFDIITVTCNEHGTFAQRADIHLRGSGCPKCVNTMTSSASQHWIDSLNLPSIVREYRIPGTRFHADAYCPLTNTVYEFYGDFWHGHPTRYDPSSTNGIKCMTFGELYEQTRHREKIIISLGYNLVTLWESDWNNLRKVK